ncbi:unnamed protein product [Penicillium salamii]|nr:unnamed protein product [Penicillium salamii]CAG8152788.1 unnamed protein product [Penicillium salamii]CAG8402210.1 unnamed protein product [Penicillium salamii]
MSARRRFLLELADSIEAPDDAAWMKKCRDKVMEALYNGTLPESPTDQSRPASDVANRGCVVRNTLPSAQ